MLWSQSVVEDNENPFENIKTVAVDSIACIINHPPLSDNVNSCIKQKEKYPTRFTYILKLLLSFRIRYSEEAIIIDSFFKVVAKLLALSIAPQMSSEGRGLG